MKPKISSLAYPLGFLSQLVRVCEEYENMMNKTMMEDKLDESSKYTSQKPRLQRNEDIKEESFLFISALLGMVPTDNDTWLIDSGVSRHMIEFRDHLTDLVEKETNLHVVLGDNARYNVKGVGTSTFQLDSEIPLQLSEVLYVTRMKRNLVSISALEDKVYKVSFSKGKVLAWHKDSHINSTIIIGVWENSLYRLTIRPFQTMLHDTISLSELWHKILSHIHY
jgi:hypothetical protein